MGDANELLIDNLIIDTEYEVSISYEVYDDVTQSLYPGTIAPVTIKTASFAAPTIKNFENKGVVAENYVFRYGYSDENDKVSSAYILVNDKKYELTSKTGNLKIAEADIDLTKSSYTIKLVLEYTNDYGKTILVESEAILLEQIETSKKGCKKKKLEAVILLTTMITVAGIILRKKDQ